MGGAKTDTWTGVAVGIAFVGAAGVIAYDAANMRVPPSYSTVGPQMVPYAVAAAMALCGAKLGYDALRGVWPSAPDEATDWRAASIAAAALFVQIYLFKRLGFVICAAAVFLAFTYAFGSRRLLRDGAIGLALALGAYSGFTYGLGLSLPPGIFKGLL